jgi:hypothetical protein
MEWTFLLHPPYLPDMAPSDLHLYGPMKKNAFGGRWFADNVDLNSGVHEELLHISKVLCDQCTASHGKVEKVCC